MKKIFALCFLALFMAGPAIAAENTAELLMIHHPECGFCKAFHRDIGVTKYNATRQGKALPLRVIDVSTNEGMGVYTAARKVNLIKKVTGTPTFIIFYNNKEVGRFVGYGGAEWFYIKLDAVMEKSLPK